MSDDIHEIQAEFRTAIEADYKNTAKFCKAEQEFLGDGAFRQKYGGGANAHGKCVSGK